MLSLLQWLSFGGSSNQLKSIPQPKEESRSKLDKPLEAQAAAHFFAGFHSFRFYEELL
ncbi:hypothetical protein D3C87_1736080 [compost metagenome]